MLLLANPPLPPPLASSAFLPSRAWSSIDCRSLPLVASHSVPPLSSLIHALIGRTAYTSRHGFVMNGFAAHGLNEDAFGEKSELQGGLKTFDAFRMSSLL